MLTILPLIQLALSLIGPILENRNVIGASTDTLIQRLTGSAAGLVTSIFANKGKPDLVYNDSMAFMGTFSGVILALKASGKVSDSLATLLNSAEAGVQKALQAFASAGKGFDATLFDTVSDLPNV